MGNNGVDQALENFLEKVVLSLRSMGHDKLSHDASGAEFCVWWEARLYAH